MRGSHIFRKGLLVLVIPWASGITTGLIAQDRPLTVNGTFATGYYSTVTRGEGNQSLSFVPFGAMFDVTGYILSPDLLDISARPEINYGPQASEAGFQGGNGITFHSTLLRKGISPLTFRYSNIQVEDIYFGSLTQLSGYSLTNRNKDLGLTWQFKPRNLPVTTVDWGINSVDSKPGIVNLSDYLSHGNHLNADSSYGRWGWDLDGFFHRQEQNSNLLSQQGGAATNGSLSQTVTQYQFSGRRGFWNDSEFYANSGSQSTSSLLITLPVDLTTHYTNANLRLFQKRRVKTSLRAGYSSNLASQLLAQAVGALSAPGSAAPDTYLLLPFSRGISNFNINGLTNVILNYGFGIYAGFERSAILSSSQSEPINASYLTTSAGMTYAHGFQWGSLSGDYGREFGIGSITGQSGTIQGQTYRVTAQRGKSGGVIVDATIHGSDQNVRNAQPLSNSSVAVESSVMSRVAGNFSARLGGGWQWGDATNVANDFRTSGYTARAGIEHPRFQAGASLNNIDSDSLPFYNQLFSQTGLVAALTGPLHIVPSDYRSMSLNLHANPLRKVEVTAVWTHSRQRLEGYVSNDFQLLNVYLTYHFRRIQVESGFIRSNQIFADYPNTMRQRFYIRFLRNTRLV